MNRQMNLPAMQRIMMEFERQSEIMEMKEDTIAETSTSLSFFHSLLVSLLFFIHIALHNSSMNSFN
jgi:hypothetical protein